MESARQKFPVVIVENSEIVTRLEISDEEE